MITHCWLVGQSVSQIFCHQETNDVMDYLARADVMCHMSCHHLMKLNSFGALNLLYRGLLLHKNYCSGLMVLALLVLGSRKF